MTFGLPGEKQLVISDLGRVDYQAGYEEQLKRWDAVYMSREQEGAEIGHILLLEHVPPVITISRRKGARTHLVATDEMLAAKGVFVAETDRGGDITYHGPGQLVAYPILDLNALGLGLHAYMRLLEEIVVRVCASFGVDTRRDQEATGVWTTSGPASSKICALGVRVRRWITLHGLALNVTTDLSHFDLIVPCGLVGRGVTSLDQELSGDAPSMDAVKSSLTEEARFVIAAALDSSSTPRSAGRR